ncbi:MAG TPA: M20/M25/M40 family metallo-hydrolase [Candidatus Limnocylindrales bacterium]|jgi:acetylornithine deacetylase/succinyl-diaminopimelate desuccinylase family protein|nr:M20/M25/M40 family metallo-hydrolase [Candidatus Limnocylindrales bacterium]
MPIIKTEKLLRELVALPSVNPAFLPKGDSRAGERNVAEFLGATAANAGLEVSFQPVLPGRSNLFARLSPRGKMRQRILLAPHLDTVVAEDSQFVPRIKDGRLFGRGACDTKGSVAAMMSALCQLATKHQRPAETEIMFVGLIDEENAQAGSRALAAKGFSADLAIVGEPTRLAIVTAHKGSLWLRIRTRGKSAHGARPELGRNAIHSMARIVHLLQTKYAAQLARKRHPLLGNATVSVGVISGGTQANIVPDECTILVDRRTLPGETEASVRQELNALLKSNHLQATHIDDKQAPCLPLETNTKNPLVRRFLQSTGQRRPAGVNYFCDAAVLAQNGIPSVAFGPGDIAQAHTADEWIALNSLERARAMLLKFFSSLP